MRYTFEEIEPVAGDRRFAFRGPGIADEHLGVFLESADEAECVRRLLESAFAAGALARAEGLASEVAALRAAFEELRAQTLRLIASPILCDHANENPHVCTCASDCYCRGRTCAAKKVPR